jgi:hypothetical protein
VRAPETFWWLVMAGALGLCAMGTWRALGIEPYGLRAGGVWWAASLGALGLGACWFDRWVGRPPRRPWSRRDTLALVSIAVVSLAFRLWRGSDYPPADMFGFEEFQTGGLAFGTMTDWWAVPVEFPLTNLLPALSFRVFGLSASALRLPFLITGSLAPLFLFAALRRVVARPAAWGAAMLLASNRWAACGARFADEIFFPVAVVSIAAWLLVRTLQDEDCLSMWAFALASGELFYAYSGYRVLPLIAGAGVLGRRPPRRTPLVPRLVLLAATWAVVLSPGVVAGETSRAPIFLEALQRHADAWGNTAGLGERMMTTAQRLLAGWGVFVWSGDEVETINIPGAPMFDGVSAALVSLAVVAACLRGRDRGRRLALAMVAFPFVAAALLPVNFNASRYFVLLLPLFFLTGYLLDDWLHWADRTGGWAVAVLASAVLLAGVLNLRTLQQLIDDPTVRDAFLYGENTVLAAVHAVPAGSEVVLLTSDGSNALEPSDYRWFTAHLRGGRPESMADALAVPAAPGGAVYWVTQGLPEAASLPRLVTLVCPQALTWTLHVDRPLEAIGVAAEGDRRRCHAVPPEAGLRGTYASIDANGSRSEVVHVDPLLWAYTIPWRLGWELQDGAITHLDIQWEGGVRPLRPGAYRFRLEVWSAGAVLNVADEVTKVTARSEAWASGTLSVSLGTEAVPIAIGLHGRPGFAPRVRLLWTPPGGREEIVPPEQLSPRGMPGAPAPLPAS